MCCELLAAHQLCLVPTNCPRSTRLAREGPKNWSRTSDRARQGPEEWLEYGTPRGAVHNADAVHYWYFCDVVFHVEFDGWFAYC